MLRDVFVPFFIGVLVFLVVGILLTIRAAANKKLPSSKDKEDNKILSDKTVENVFDVGDQFNRARYMDEDGK